MKKKVLIVTYSEDNECINMVQKVLKAENAEVFRFDTDTFPTETQLTLTESQKGRRLRMCSSQVEVDLEEIDAVWYRRMRIGENIPLEMDPKLREPSLLESRTVVIGLLESLDTFIVDPYHKVRLSSNKELQLDIARRMGLNIPRTLISNHPEEVRAFYKTCKNGMITKALSSFAVMEDGKEHVVFTTRVEDNHLEDLEGLSLCPMTFQELVPKKVELRITAVGNQLFAASIDPGASRIAGVDWRRDGRGLVERWQNYTLPKETEIKLMALMDCLGLNYGAIDMIVTPDNRYVFLEINPVGEFYWLELYNPRFPISTAIANVLLGKSARR
ncbi:MAG: MvdD family ATP-grasp ribosomal peptide maturase [bacterium]|nr:MvdD family ATP-grasp ribosomal peptide maturase [bacterium]